MRDNEGAIPTFIQALFGIIDYVAIEVVEPLLPRVRLLKQWVRGVLFNWSYLQNQIANKRHVSFIEKQIPFHVVCDYKSLTSEGRLC